MLLTEIDHVAIAVRDLDAAIDYYAKAFGATVAHREIVERDGVEEALIKVADSYIQLTAATRDDSPIAKAIEKRGEGLHHVGYRVNDCAAALAAMVAAGATAIDKEPRPGSRGTTVASRSPTSGIDTTSRVPGAACSTGSIAYPMFFCRRGEWMAEVTCPTARPPAATGHRVALMRLRNSVSSASGTLMLKGRMASPPVAAPALAGEDDGVDMIILLCGRERVRGVRWKRRRAHHVAVAESNHCAVARVRYPAMKASRSALT